MNLAKKLYLDRKRHLPKIVTWTRNVTWPKSVTSSNKRDFAKRASVYIFKLKECFNEAKIFRFSIFDQVLMI